MIHDQFICKYPLYFVGERPKWLFRIFKLFYGDNNIYIHAWGKKDMAMGGNRMCVGKRSVLELLPHLKEMCVYELQFSSLVG